MANYMNLFSNNTLKNNIEKITLGLNWQNADNNSIQGLFTWSWNNLTRPNITNPEQLKYITRMDTVFRQGNTYKLNLENWDVSNVRDLSWFLDGQSRLREVQFSSWDTSNVLEFDRFFDGCYNLKEVNISNWNTSKGQNFSSMFEYAPIVADLSKWDFSAAQNMYGMFMRGTNRNLKVNGEWAFSNSVNSGYLFAYCSGGDLEFSTPLTAPNLRNANYMFYNWVNINSITNFRWCPSIVEAKEMFANLINSNVAFLGDLENWDVSNLKNAERMFYGNTLINYTNLDLSRWNVSNLRNAGGFLDPWKSAWTMPENWMLNLNLANWNLSEYSGGHLLNSLWTTQQIDTSNWILNNTNMCAMFDNDTNLKEIIGYENWNMNNVYDISYIFYNCQNLNVNLNHWAINANKIHGAFYCMNKFSIDVSKWNTSRVESIANMFQKVKLVTGLSNWDATNFINLSGAFSSYQGNNLNEIWNWNISKVTAMDETFGWTPDLPIIDLSKWKFNVPLNTINSCFPWCEKLTEIKGLEKWDTSLVKNFSQLFMSSKNLKKINVENWNVSNVNSFHRCFAGIGVVNLNLQNWKPVNCLNFSLMFDYAPGIEEVDFSSAYTPYSNANLSFMFNNVVNLKNVYLNSFRFNESMNTVNMFGVSTAPHCNVWVRDLMAKNFLLERFPTLANVYIASTLSIDDPNQNYSIMNTKNLEVSFDIYGGSDGFINQNLNVTTSSSTQKTTSTGQIDYVNGLLKINIQAVGEGNDQITAIVSDSSGNTAQVVFDVTITPYIPTFYEVSPVNGSAYTFELNTNGYYESNNKGQDNSYAMCKVTFKTSTGKLILDCINYAENNYDFGILSNLDIDPSLSLNSSADTNNVYYSFKGKSQSTVQTVSYTGINDEEHFIYIKYRKDSSASNNNDSLQFKVRFE